jgi:large repetitive protein
LKRLLLIAVLAAVLFGVNAGSGSAASFVDYKPCPASGPLLVCPTMQVGQPYSVQLLAHTGCDVYWWETRDSTPPPGTTLSRSGLVSGTPTEVGEWVPWVWVHDLTASMGGPSWCGGDSNSQRQFVFRVVPGLSIQDQSVPGGTVNEPYSRQLTVWSITHRNPDQGSPTTATWSIASGSLPPGVTLSSNGLLNGTPTGEGSFTFVVRAVGGGGVTDTETETLTVRQPLALTAPLTTAKAEVGMPFTSQQTATGGSGAFTWSGSNLPAGLRLANDGTISGTPSLAGRFAIKLTVTDSESRSKSVSVTLVVKQKLAFKTLKLKSGAAGTAYRLRILMSGGVGPFTWRLTGKAPKGFKLSKTGQLIGTPTKAGNYRFTVTVTDALGAVAKKTLTLSVK